MKIIQIIKYSSLSMAIVMTTGCAGMAGLGEFALDMAECYAGVNCTEKSSESSYQRAASNAAIQSMATYQPTYQKHERERQLRTAQYEYDSKYGRSSSSSESSSYDSCVWSPETPCAAQ